MAKQGNTTITKDLSEWVTSITLDKIPNEIQTRAKHIILDGIGCALVGARLPWSAKAAETLFSIDPSGSCRVVGWNRGLPTMDAALLNSSFIQGFELDDWHSEAPSHSNSIILPSLFSAAQTLQATKDQKVTGNDFLLSTLIGYEIGPRVGKALWGTYILTQGWHSGAVFGPSASAAAVGRLLKLSPDQMNEAFGSACTQACGLMSAQFGSDVKRMQHGFAARNGLLACYLTQGGYAGIRDIYDLTYGGFLDRFSAGNEKTPQFLPEEVTKDLGSFWQTTNVCIKPYAAMAGTHSTVDCVRNLQEKNPELNGPEAAKVISKIRIILADAAYSHGGWKATRPLQTTGAQMSNAFIAATQIVHGSVLAAQFKHDCLENDDVWTIVDKTECELNTDKSAAFGQQTVEITLTNGKTISNTVQSARGVNPRLENAEIIEKYDSLTESVIDTDRAEKIKNLVLNLESCEDIEELFELLDAETKNPIA